MLPLSIKNAFEYVLILFVKQFRFPLRCFVCSRENSNKLLLYLQLQNNFSSFLFEIFSKHLLIVQKLKIFFFQNGTLTVTMYKIVKFLTKFTKEILQFVLMSKINHRKISLFFLTKVTPLFTKRRIPNKIGPKYLSSQQSFQLFQNFQKSSPKPSRTENFSFPPRAIRRIILGEKVNNNNTRSF